MPNLYDGQIPWNGLKMQSHALEGVGYYMDTTTGVPLENAYSLESREKVKNGTATWVSTFAWRDPDPFVATLKLSERSLRYGKIDPLFSVLDGSYEGGTAVMFVSEFMRMLQEVTLDKGVVKGLWGFRKQGSNYSLVFMEPR